MPTYEERSKQQEAADRAAGVGAKAARDAEIRAWHKSFGSTPHNEPADLSNLSPAQLIETGLKQDSESPRAQSAANPATSAPPADLSTLSPVQLIELGLRQDGGLSIRQRDAARAAAPKKPLPEGWQNLPAHEKVLLGLDR
jgi:hypothetical protein